MKITEFLSEEMVLIGIKPESKTNLCEIVVDHLISRSVISKGRRQILIDKIMERESLSSTGIGDGVAIPHASGESIDKMIVAIAQIPDGMDFASIDDKPVNLVFMIIGSERVPRVHLRLLATIVRACKNRELVKSLKEADESKKVFDLIVSFDNG